MDKKKKEKPTVLYWNDFLNEIKLVMEINKKTEEVTYKGQFEINGQKFAGEYKWPLQAIKDNSDGLDYIDEFSRLEIAKVIFEKIQRYEIERRRKGVLNNVTNI